MIYLYQKEKIAQINNIAILTKNNKNNVMIVKEKDGENSKIVVLVL